MENDLIELKNNLMLIKCLDHIFLRLNRKDLELMMREMNLMNQGGWVEN